MYMYSNIYENSIHCIIYSVCSHTVVCGFQFFCRVESIIRDRGGTDYGDSVHIFYAKTTICFTSFGDIHTSLRFPTCEGLLGCSFSFMSQVSLTACTYVSTIPYLNINPYSSMMDTQQSNMVLYKHIHKFS